MVEASLEVENIMLHQFITFPEVINQGCKENYDKGSVFFIMEEGHMLRRMSVHCTRKETERKA